MARRDVAARSKTVQRHDGRYSSFCSFSDIVVGIGVEGARLPAILVLKALPHDDLYRLKLGYGH